MVPADGASLDPEEIRGNLAELLAKYKVPGQVRLVEELPRTTTGKIRKAVLRESA